MAPDVAGSIPVTHPNPHSPSAHRAVAFSSRAVLWALLVVWLVAGCGVDTAAERVQPERAVRTPAGTGGTNHPSVVSEPHVVLVSFDGFRADYLDRFDTPNFDRLATRGIRADGLTSVFPSLTFPAHYSISTGLYPESHGIVGNRFFDPERDDEFNYRDRDDAQDGSWWGGEPIWVTAETQGMVAAAFFFPGTEAAIAGVRPSHWQPYDGRVANTDRVDQVVEWLSLPPERRPHFVALYFSLVDGAGHRIGPDAPGMRPSVESADRLLGRLIDRVDALPHGDRVALVVVSDHGMAAPDPARQTVLPELADLSGVRLVATGPAMSLHVGDADRSRAIRDSLNEVLLEARAYLRDEVPTHLHYRDNRRIGDVVVIPDEGGSIRFRRGDALPRGLHGWDPTLASMHGIFLAAGPGLAAGAKIAGVESVDVYPLVAHVLDLAPHPDIDGTLAPFSTILVSRP